MSLTMKVATYGAKNGTHLRDNNGMYTWRGNTYPSVTTILKVVNKDRLLLWAADSVAKEACSYFDLVRAASSLDDLREYNEFPDYDTLRNTPWRYRDEKARIGTATHDVMERVAKELPVNLEGLDDAVRPYVDSALAWVEESKPEFLVSERACFNKYAGYAGTFDAIVSIDGRLLILDYKTSSSTTEDHALQLAAYRHATFYAGYEGEELPMPRVDGGAILVVQPGRSRLYEWDCDHNVFDRFLAAERLWRWKNAAGAKPKPTLLNRMKRGKKKDDVR